MTAFDGTVVFSQVANTFAIIPTQKAWPFAQPMAIRRFSTALQFQVALCAGCFVIFCVFAQASELLNTEESQCSFMVLGRTSGDCCCLHCAHYDTLQPMATSALAGLC
jgi:hypothetical protein